MATVAKVAVQAATYAIDKVYDYLLPPELAEEVSPFITGSLLTAEENRLLKAADRLSALIKCMEEQRSGNHEFDAALAQQKAALQAMHCPEADWFIEHCLPCYTQNLDELTRQDG